MTLRTAALLPLTLALATAIASAQSLLQLQPVNGLPVPQLGTRVTTLAAGDLDGDGDTDLAVCEGGDAVLTVADRGPGIAAEDLPRIWDRLYRGDKSRSQRGLGLGLSFVRAIAVAHGGSATVESAPGEGAAFRIRLPATA